MITIIIIIMIITIIIIIIVIIMQKGLVPSFVFSKFLYD